MRAAIVSIALTALAIGPYALAADYDGNTGTGSDAAAGSPSGQPGQAGGETAPVSEVSSRELTHGTLKNENISLKAEGGFIGYTDTVNNSTGRFVGGLGLDWNILNTFATNYANPIYFGISTGALYSHMGSSTSNFFGASPTTVVSDPGANMLIIPSDLKLGYTFLDNLRVSAHGGGNVIYRSIANAVNFGSSSTGTGSVWRIFPDVGGDVDIGLGKSIALTLRPDVTFTPGNSLFTGTVGIGVALG